jgi:hypothetical protein
MLFTGDDGVDGGRKARSDRVGRSTTYIVEQKMLVTLGPDA